MFQEPPAPAALVSVNPTPRVGIVVAQLPGSDAQKRSTSPNERGQFLYQGRPLTQFNAERITYTGDCPGDGPNTLTGVSFLAAASPAPYQRIVIRNLNTGGFSDREYDERRPGSEGFSLSLGDGQHGSFLSVAPGLNQFTYTIRNRLQDTRIADGMASLQVNVEEVSRLRSFTEIKEKKYCTGNRFNSPSRLQDCPDGLVTVERTGVCPGGADRVLSLETVRVGKGGGTPRIGW